MASCEFRYTVLFEPAEEGGYIVTCPALPGLVTEGDSLEEGMVVAIGLHSPGVAERNTLIVAERRPAGALVAILMNHFFPDPREIGEVERGRALA